MKPTHDLFVAVIRSLIIGVCINIILYCILFVLQTPWGMLPTPLRWCMPAHLLLVRDFSPYSIVMVAWLLNSIAWAAVLFIIGRAISRSMG